MIFRLIYINDELMIWKNYDVESIMCYYYLVVMLFFNDEKLNVYNFNYGLDKKKL